MASLSRDSVSTGKVILVLLLACFAAYMMHQQKAEDHLRGEQLTLEEYTEGFEAHKAKLSKPPTPLLPGILIMASLLGLTFAIYEALGRLIGLLLQRAGITSDSDEPDALPEDIPGRTDMSVPMGRVGVVSLVMAPVLAALTLIPSIWIWGRLEFKNDLKQTEWGWVLLVALLAGIVLHELLHGVGYVWFGRGRWKDLKFGFKLKHLAAYASTSSPLTASAYRGAVVLPGLVVGVLPLLAAIALGSGWLLLFGYLLTVGAAGDLTILWKIRNVDGSAKVIDHTHRAGCWVLNDEAEEDATNTPDA